MINYQDFDYNGSKITFSKGKNVYVCATQMAKPFGKNPSDWLRNQTAQDYISAVADETQIPVSELVITRKGGGSIQTSQGTWMHKDVAMEFARWLAPKFGIWCNRRIEELLTTGKVELPKSTSSECGLPAPTADVTKNDSILTTAQRAIDKEYTFAQVGGMIIWHGKPMRRPLLQAWMYEHGFLCTKDGFSNYPTELALALGLMTVVDRRKRGAQTKLKNPKVRITMDGANYFINVLQHGLRGIFPAKTTNGLLNMKQS